MNIPSLPILMKKLTAQKEKDLIKKIQIQFEAVKNITYTGEMLEGSTGIFDYYFEGTSSQGKKISLSIDDLGTITGHPFLPAHNNMKSLTVTPEHYRTLVDKVYHVDKLKADHRKLRKSHVFMTKDGQEWLVIKTIDANDSRNRKGYTDNGFQDMAVIPKTLEFPRGDASQTLIVYAGTNPLDEKDLRTDVLNIV
ncbi:MAG: hypothetical protein FWE43_01855, partial [Streptococcaceae bacterium]|nr:hypothetical protein [Streptococcaceae bacterium]